MGKFLTKSQRQQSNWEFFYRHVLENSNIQSKDDVCTCFYAIERKYREMLIIRYGLEGDHKSASEDFLIKQSGLKNAAELYEQSEIALKNQIYDEALVDKYYFKRKTAIALGMLATDLVHITNSKPVYEKTFYGERVLKILDILTKRERTIIEQLYGLDGLGRKSLSKVASLNHVSSQRISQIKAEVFLNLRREKEYICVQ